MESLNEIIEVESERKFNTVLVAFFLSVITTFTIYGGTLVFETKLFGTLKGNSITGSAFDSILLERNPMGFKMNLLLFRLYPVLGYDGVTRSVFKYILSNNPVITYDTAGNSIRIKSVTSMSSKKVFGDFHVAQAMPSSITLTERFGDCDDFAFLIANGYNQSYVANVFVKTPAGTGFHSFPIVKAGDEWYVIDVVGGVMARGRTLNEAIQSYEHNAFLTDVIVMSLYRVR